jgi:hypothetical protein
MSVFPATVIAEGFCRVTQVWLPTLCGIKQIVRSNYIDRLVIEEQDANVDRSYLAGVSKGEC